MSQLAVSQIQRHFMNCEMYKRSKKYFDVIKLNSMEKIGSKSRRIPATDKTDVDRKMQKSFNSSIDYYNKRRQQEISRSKRKSQGAFFNDDLDQTQTNCSIPTKSHQHQNFRKSFDMGKSLSRQFYQKLYPHNRNIEDNFVSNCPSDFEKGLLNNRSVDFNKLLGRRDTISANNNYEKMPRNKDALQQNPEKSKIYQKVIYSQSIFRCLFDVQKEKKAQQRRISRQNEKKKAQKPLKLMNLQKIEQGRIATKKAVIKNVDLMFFNGKGKQQISAMHMKSLKYNQNHWANQLRQESQKEEYESMRMREQMKSKKLQLVRKRKCVEDQRGQICDSRYFLRQDQRKKRLNLSSRVLQ